MPARNEEAVIAACVESLARQPEIGEIIVVDDQSSDRTSEILRELAARIPHLRVMETGGLPEGWVGKNYAVSLGAARAAADWLLFTDADAVHLAGSAGRALEAGESSGAALVSYSPEQVTETWWEKALIPFVYARLAQRYSYVEVNDPESAAAAANGQYLLIRRDAYEAAGGHASVHGEILEDVALARRVKAVGYRIWFAVGEGIVRVRMYRTFRAMWKGWKKNLYLLVGGVQIGVGREIGATLPMEIAFLIVFLWFQVWLGVALACVALLWRHLRYMAALKRNHFSVSFIKYYVPAAVMYAGVLYASFGSYLKGGVEWKGRKYTVKETGSLK